jgi:hypothetical protein
MRRNRTALIAVGVALAAAVVAWRQVRAAYTSAFMDVTWEPYTGTAGQPVAGRISNWNGTPAVGQEVTASDDGGTAEATTDAEGKFELHVRAPLRSLTVVGIDTIPVSRWNLPRGDAGVKFEVHLKRPPPPPRGPL